MSNILITHKFLSCVIDISVFNTQLSMSSITINTFQIAFITFPIIWTRLTRICSNTHKWVGIYHFGAGSLKLKLHSVWGGQTSSREVFRVLSTKQPVGPPTMIGIVPELCQDFVSRLYWEPCTVQIPLVGGCEPTYDTLPRGTPPPWTIHSSRQRLYLPLLRIRSAVTIVQRLW